MAVRAEMPVRIVNSKQNARLKELRRALRSPDRPAGGLVGIEGPHLIEEALRSGLRVRCLFAGDGFQHWLARLCLGAETETLVMPKGILASTFVTETPQPVAALVEPPEWTWEHVLGPRNRAPLVIVLAGLQDPGNLGTIMRSAEAFGANGAVGLPGTVSCWNQKAMRASAGSVFRLPLVQAGVDECLLRLREAGVKVLTTALHSGTPAQAVDFMQPTALLIGNEGNGVPDDIAAHAAGAVTIPCPGPVESLNASVAASVLLYEASRQRAAHRSGS
jgi:TrmH family RNA methyltransferase